MKKCIMLTLAAAAVVFFFVTVTKAADPNKPKMDKDIFRGMLVVTKDANSVITSAKLENRRWGTFNIVLDEKGKALAEEMADKFVKIIGQETTKDGEKWLTVEEYREMQIPQGRGPHGRRGPGEPNAPGDEQ